MQSTLTKPESSLESDTTDCPIDYDLKLFSNEHHAQDCLFSPNIVEDKLKFETLDRTINYDLKMLSNEELVKKYQDGVTAALNELIVRYRGSILSSAYRLSRNYDAAEDVTAEACYRICRAVQNCKHPEALPAWINRIVRNVWLDSLRRSQRRSEVSLNILENFSGEGGTAIDTTMEEMPLQKIVEENDRKRILRSAIGKLPESQGRIVHLFYMEDRPYEEIAEIMSIPIGTVKSRLNRARYALRGKLTRHISAFLD